ncbi:MAG: hypothetical protein IPM39_25820 [Chloroflexi bacterium]|nr:hypothetical protein [Chloroflexota bacterium]
MNRLLLALNESAQLQEPLVLVHPQEGIITADYPLMLLNEEKREEYDALVGISAFAGIPAKLMETTLRRPVIPGSSIGQPYS